MKKILMMLAIAACAVSASAATYTVHVDILARWDPVNKKSVSGYNGEDVKMSYYTAYALNNDDAYALITGTGGTESKTVSYSEVVSWLSDNYQDNAAAWKGAQNANASIESKKVEVKGVSYLHMYNIFSEEYTSPQSAIDDNRLLVVFYHDENNNNAFRVARNKTNYGTTFDSGNCNWSAWTAAPDGPDPIPEPTSGLLLLLGVAGLALKRRRA